ncbi:MAG: signal peptidase I [Caldiserica bacterium]|nr:signal peptidase I [Caldisericota bacterium]
MHDVIALKIKEGYNFSIVSKKTDWKKVAKEWGQSLLYAVVVALFIRTFFFQAYRIPTGSMIPTLKIGDHLIVNKVVYKIREPVRGEVIVFIFPKNPKKTFVKRLIALPGDRVKIEDGKVFIDGKPITSIPQIASRYYYAEGPYGEKEITVPPNSLFVLGDMGDNTTNSNDSRFWGFVPRKNLIGKPIFIYFPPWRWGIIR